MFKNFVRVWWQYVIPQHCVSRLVGVIAGSRFLALKRWAINTFIKQYQVDMSLALKENPDDYPTFNDFFIRQLKPDARAVCVGEKNIMCPVDGSVSEVGDLNGDSILQAKGFSYSVSTLLGGRSDLAEKFVSGKFATLYLSPKDYHRVHMPFSGKLKEMIYVPGKLFSVNQSTVNNVPGLFARNERVVCIFETEIGPMAVVFVGAVIVASIVTQWAGLVAPTRPRHITSYQYQDNYFSKGDELGYFKLGSTAIVLFGQGCMNWLSELQSGDSVCMGMKIGELL